MLTRESLLHGSYRVFQKTMWAAQNTVLYFRIPQVTSGTGALLKVPQIIQSLGAGRVLVVTDKTMRQLGLLQPLEDECDKAGIALHIFDETVANPTIDNIEKATQLCLAKDCQAIVLFGGGSAMDCGKAVAARVACPKKTVPQMKGLLKIRRKVMPLIAVPTTAGTGSEATLAAVVTNPETREKYAVNDPALIPEYAVLDPELTRGLPPFLTSTTGMDALTHAVEAYIGHANTELTEKCALNATCRIFTYLERACENGEDLKARSQMQLAALEAGMAFTRAYVGNVHAIAHTLSGFYNVPHGLANAVILPYVLEYYGEKVHPALARLSLAAGFPRQSSQSRQAAAFIREIRKMNQRMGIPDKLEGIRGEDLPLMIARAMQEANPLYPVPVIFTKQDFYNLYRSIQK